MQFHLYFELDTSFLRASVERSTMGPLDRGLERLEVALTRHRHKKEAVLWYTYFLLLASVPNLHYFKMS